MQSPQAHIFPFECSQDSFYLKCVASCVFLMGSMSTSFTMTLTSEPEKPCHARSTKR